MTKAVMGKDDGELPVHRLLLKAALVYRGSGFSASRPSYQPTSGVYPRIRQSAERRSHQKYSTVQ
jgi:hypothetical protein